VAQETARLEQLLAARDRLARNAARSSLWRPVICELLRERANGKILVANHDIADVAATLAFSPTQPATDCARELHAEFLIDRSGYIRARWLPVGR
jgi:putative copper resistance protein D